MDSSTLTSETGETVYLFTFISSFVSFGLIVYVQYFFDKVRNQTLNNKLIKKRSKAHAKNTLRERALNFHQ